MPPEPRIQAPPEAFQEALQAALKSIGYFRKGHAQTEAALKGIGDKILAQVMELRAAEKRRRDLPALIATEEKKAASATRHIEILREIVELQAAQKALQEEETEAVVTADEEALAAREAGVRTRLAELKTLLEQKELQKAAEIAFTRALQERQENEEDLAVVKAALDVVGPKGMQAEAAKVAAGPFLTAVNLVLRRFDLEAYVVTERNGKAVFEWGLVNKGGSSPCLQGDGCGVEHVWIASKRDDHRVSTTACCRTVSKPKITPSKKYIV